MYKLSVSFFSKINSIAISLQLLTLYVFVLFWRSLGYIIDSYFIIVNSFSLSLLTIILFNGIVYYYFLKEKVSLKIIFNNLIFFFLFLAFLIFVSTFFWDNSYDGQTYHLQGIHELSNGWNPFKTQLNQSVASSIFINHYAKAFEIFGSSIFLFTGEFETTKVSNLMLFFTAWMLSFSYFKTVFANKFIKSFVYSTLLILNPVITTQIFTLLFDCQIALLLIILFFSFLFYLQHKKWAIVFWSSGIIILISLKFTGLVYASIFSFFAFIYLLYFRNKDLQLLKKFTAVSFFAFLFSISFISLNPYVTNVSAGKHIFYPLMGKNAVNIMAGTNAPKSFENKNRFQKFIIANTSISSNIHGSKIAPEPQFKYPFEVKLKEWTVFKSASVLYGGLGPLFFSSLILVLFSLLYFFLYKINFKSSFFFYQLLFYLVFFLIQNVGFLVMYPNFGVYLL